MQMRKVGGWLLSRDIVALRVSFTPVSVKVYSVLAKTINGMKIKRTQL